MNKARLVLVAMMLVGYVYTIKWMKNSWLGPCIDGPKKQWEQRMAEIDK